MEPRGPRASVWTWCQSMRLWVSLSQSVKIKAISRDVGIEGVGLCAPVFSLLSIDAPVHL